jgi:hypothetical protein
MTAIAYAVLVATVVIPTGASAAASDGIIEAGSGPVMKLSYSERTFETNPVSTFMYFVPLIATTPVDRQTSAGNNQEVAIVSFKRKSGTRTFAVKCEFEIRGSGFHRITFDPAVQIHDYAGEMKENATLTGMLDYIQLDGEGLGRIDVSGTIDGQTETVTEVALRFNMHGRKSPVTIALYDIEPRDRQYTYENRSNQSVARVNTITFKRSDSNPAMGVTLASVAKAGEEDGFWARIKGVIANLVIKPPKIAELGNETMLDFGFALLEKKPEFTFPLAGNIRTDMMVSGTAPEP